MDQLALALNRMNMSSRGHRPPEYHSTTSAHIFISSFDDWVELQQESDRKAALAFKNSIKDEIALMWLDRLPQTIKKSYVKLREKFLQSYDEAAPEFYKMTLTEAPRQRSNETVRQYHRRFYKSFSRMASDDKLTTEFVKGLLGKYKLHIYQESAPKDLTAAMKIACKWEEILMDAEGAWEDETSSKNRQALMVNATPGQQVGHVGMMQCSSGSEAKNQDNILGCYRCGSPNHYIKFCPQSSAGTAQRSRGNYNKSNRGYNANVLCFVCGERHYASECENRFRPVTHDGSENEQSGSQEHDEEYENMMRSK